MVVEKEKRDIPSRNVPLKFFEWKVNFLVFLSGCLLGRFLRDLFGSLLGHLFRYLFGGRLFRYLLLGRFFGDFACRFFGRLFGSPLHGFFGGFLSSRFLGGLLFCSHGFVLFYFADNRGFLFGCHDTHGDQREDGLTQASPETFADKVPQAGCQDGGSIDERFVDMGPTAGVARGQPLFLEVAHHCEGGCVAAVFPVAVHQFMYE